MSAFPVAGELEALASRLTSTAEQRPITDAAGNFAHMNDDLPAAMLPAQFIHDLANERPGIDRPFDSGWRPNRDRRNSPSISAACARRLP